MKSAAYGGQLLRLPWGLESSPFLEVQFLDSRSAHTEQPLQALWPCQAALGTLNATSGPFFESVTSFRNPFSRSSQLLCDMQGRGQGVRFQGGQHSCDTWILFNFSLCVYRSTESAVERGRLLRFSKELESLETGRFLELQFLHAIQLNSLGLWFDNEVG